MPRGYPRYVRIPLSELRSHKPSESSERYLNALEKTKLKARLFAEVESEDGLDGCKRWVGPERIALQTKGVRESFDPYRAFLFTLGLREIRPECFLPKCSSSRCFEPTHYERWGLSELNQQRFAAHLSVEEGESGCLLWSGPKKFRLFTDWGDALVEPRKFLLAQTFRSWEERELAFFACGNDLCHNAQHATRGRTKVESREEEFVKILGEVGEMLSNYGLASFGSECLEIEDTGLQEMSSKFPGALTRGRPLNLSLGSTNIRYMYSWLALAAFMYSRHAFFAIPSGFRPLGVVSEAVRKKAECQVSPTCVNPKHRIPYLRWAYGNKGKARFAWNRDENTLFTSANFGSESLDVLEFSD